MDLSVLGWLLTVSDIYAMGGPKYQLKDLSVEVDKVSKLKATILSQPGFSIENFRDTSFHRSGDVGIFASAALRSYLFEENQNPEETGLLILFFYEPRQEEIGDFNSRPKQPIHLMLANKTLNPDIAKTLLLYADDGLKKSQ